MEVRRLATADRQVWAELWHAYLEFYEHPLPSEVTDLTWDRITGEDASVIGLGAVDDGAIVGFCHLIVHPSTWTTTTYCYLEDLFVRPNRRAGGVGRALIDAAVREARAHGSTKLYWQTHVTNANARRLYDRMADHRGFIVYEVDL